MKIQKINIWYFFAQKSDFFNIFMPVFESDHRNFFIFIIFQLNFYIDKLKIEATKEYGGHVILYDRYKEDREAIAK